MVDRCEFKHGCGLWHDPGVGPDLHQHLRRVNDEPRSRAHGLDTRNDLLFCGSIDWSQWRHGLFDDLQFHHHGHGSSKSKLHFGGDCCDCNRGIDRNVNRYDHSSQWLQLGGDASGIRLARRHHRDVWNESRDRVVDRHHQRECDRRGWTLYAHRERDQRHFVGQHDHLAYRERGVAVEGCFTDAAEAQPDASAVQPGHGTDPGIGAVEVAGK